jgi:sugar transferase (PEP-CTERM/EpsH1 system associated)
MKVLYLTHRVPYAPNRGDRIRAYHTLRFLRENGISTHVVALAHDDEEYAAAGQLNELCTSWDVIRVPRLRNLVRGAIALAGTRPLTHMLLDSPRLREVLARCRVAFEPDVVMAFCSGMARFALEPPLDDLPFVLDIVDVDSEKWSELAGQVAWPFNRIYGRESRRLAAFERQAAAAARVTFAINDAEAALLRELAPGAHVITVPNGVDVDYFRRPADFERRPHVIFTAVFDYPPNEAGALWTVEHVWPKVLKARPDATLMLVGARPTARLRRAVAAAQSVTLTGTVPDVRPHLWRSTVAIAPLALARGTQNKVLEALAAGLPIVSTPQVSAGLPDGLRCFCTASDSPQSFANAVIDWLAPRNPSPQRDAPRPVTWRGALAHLPDLMGEAAGYAAKRPGVVSDWRSRTDPVHAGASPANGGQAPLRSSTTTE